MTHSSMLEKAYGIPRRNPKVQQEWDDAHTREITVGQEPTRAERALDGRLSERETIYAAGQSSILERHAQVRADLQVRAELNKPLPHIDDPATRCRVLQAAFRFRPKLGAETYTPAVGDVITMPRTEAKSLEALGQVLILT
jgi:hypothetical protein